MTYDFDRLIDRRRTDSSKWQTYGPDVLPLWVADMDFQSPEPVIRALRERVEHGVFGYLMFEQPEFHQLFADPLIKRYGWRVSLEEPIGEELVDLRLLEHEVAEDTVLHPLGSSSATAGACRRTPW